MTKRRVVIGSLAVAVVAFGAALAAQQLPVAGTATTPGNIWPPAMKAPAGSPALSPADALKTFSVPPGFHVELVASEPMIESPILMDFDADGRLYVLEQLSFLPDMSGRDSREPINRVSVLEDTDNDGQMDKKTVFADKLLMPRALKVLDRGVLIGEPPNLWLMKDTNGDLVADTKELVVNTYGNANGGIEHNANSLYWAMDNTMYSSEHTWDLKLTGGTFESLPALSRGQWQVSQDDAGRIFRNVNDAPLYVDYTPARYFLRNPNAARTRGLYESLIDQADATVYPVRPNRGVNRGYRDPFFRKDGSSTVIQGSGTPTIYRGNKYPADHYGNAFITDSPTNLVHRLVLENKGGGQLTARNGYARGEFIASSDERFRPVSLFDGPDGNMYVVDMYRGVVQAEGIWSEYLAGYIKANNMQLPVARGRIWRLVYGTGADRRGPKPALSTATPNTLVQTLTHPIGWWRDTAQRLLVERGDRSVVPNLTYMAGNAADWKTRLHALWTIDGLGAMTPAVVQKALQDGNADVRAAGVRIAEVYLRSGDAAVTAAVLKKATDPAWNVRRQAAASIGELPAASRVAPAVAILSSADGADGIIVDALVSGLRGVENEVLDRVLQARATAPQPTEAVSMLAAALTKSGDVATVQKLLAIATDSARPNWQRMAVLGGVDVALPASAAARGRGLPGLSIGRTFTTTPGRGVSLPGEPASLTLMASGPGDLAAAAKVVADKLNWPGRPTPVVTAAPLTAEQQKRHAAGAEIYKNICLGCHQEDGRGREKIGASLVGSAYVTAADPTSAIRILLSGKEGQIGLMPPVGPAMNDEQIASALTFVRRNWGNAAPVVDPMNVMEIRGLTRDRNRPWTDAELAPQARAGGAGGGRGGAGGGGRGGAGGRGAGQ